MEEPPPVKVSVSELAGKFKSHSLPMPRNNERKSVQGSPSCSLQLHDQMDSECKKEKTTIKPQPLPKTKLKNSPFIEKLQANPILSPTILLSTAKSPEGKQQAISFCPISPCHPQSPNLRPPKQHGANEVPISFEQPAEGTTLPSFNKSRVRLSFKRRPPTRQHRTSTGEESPEENRSPCDLHSPDNTPDRNASIKDAVNVSQEETHESQEDSIPLIIVQDMVLPEEHDVVTKDNEGTKDTEMENKDEVAEKNDSGNPEASEAVDNQEDEQAHEEDSTGEMEESEKEDETFVEPTEESMEALDQDQDQASGD